jgi:RNA polymerase sigma factor (sigma-70 family)
MNALLNAPPKPEVASQIQLADWIAAIASGKSAALGALYDATNDALSAVAMRIVRNAADADDVLREMFKHVWERPKQYQQDRGPVIAWLFVITRSRALDLLRKRRPEVQLDELAYTQLQAHGTAEPAAEDLLQALQMSGELREALVQLSSEQRRMLDLAFFHDMSHFEISERTGVALGTVKSHIRRGQQALKHILEARGFTHER